MSIHKTEGIVLREIHSVYFLVNIKEKFSSSNRLLVKINDVGKIIWDLLDKTDDLKDLTNRILAIYNISEPDVFTITEDIISFLRQLQMIRYIQYE